MKREMTINGIEHRELEKQMEGKRTKIREKALWEAGKAASRDTQILESVLTEVNADIASLGTEIKKTLQSKSQQQKVDKSREEMIDKCSLLLERKAPLEKKVKSLEVDMERLGIPVSKWRKWFPKLAILLILASDILMNYKSFQLLASNMLLGLLIALITLAMIAIAAHLIGKKMQEAKTKQKAILWFAIGLTGGAIVFLGLGFLRQGYYQGDGIVSNPFLFALFNLVFYCCAIAVSAIYGLPKAIKEKQEQYEQIKEEHAKALQKEETIQKEIQAEKDTQSQKEADLSDLLDYEEHLLEQLEKDRVSIHASCKKEYALKGGATDLLTANN